MAKRGEQGSRGRSGAAQGSAGRGASAERRRPGSRPHGSTPTGATPPTGQAVEAGGVRVLYQDRDVLVLDRGPHATPSAVRQLLRQHTREPRAPGQRTAWPVGTLERGVTGLLLVTCRSSARRALEREGATRLRYVAVTQAEGAGHGSSHQGPPGRGGLVELEARGGTRVVSLERGRPHRDLAGWLLRRGYRVVRDRERRDRLLLHAHTLSFTHPVSGASLTFESAVPPDMTSGASALREVSAAGSERRDSALDHSASDRAARPERSAPHRAGSDRARPDRAASERAATGRTAPDRAAPDRATDWDAVADWFDTLLEAREHDHYRDVILPGVVRLLDARPGQRVLDLACGQGILCRTLAEQGVKSVGVEASPRLVERARERSEGLGALRPRFHVADARALDELRLGTFHRASCILALSNLDPIEPVLASCARCLLPGGLFVAVVPHPAFRIPRRSHWHWERDERGHSHQSRRIEAYLSPLRIPIVANPGAVSRGAPPVETWTFHRPLEHYVRALAQAGLLVDRLEEWISARTSDSGPRAPEENRARREIPLFLALRARRVPSAEA